jgi:hypothetical protein
MAMISSWISAARAAASTSPALRQVVHKVCFREWKLRKETDPE